MGRRCACCSHNATVDNSDATCALSPEGQSILAGRTTTEDNTEDNYSPDAAVITTSTLATEHTGCGRR